MKRILGLDLGTNSIGWALIEKDDKQGKILGMGSRIIPMGVDKTNFESGNAYTKNADRRQARSIRRLNHRFKLRRNKLLYVLNEIDMLPEFIKFSKPFPDPIHLQELDILPISNRSRQLTAIELYELRKKALYEKISLEELGRLFMLFNQLRGYAGGEEENEKDADKTENDEEKDKSYEVIVASAKIQQIEKTNKIERGKDVFELTIQSEDGTEYKGTSVVSSFRKDEETEIEIRINRSKKGEQNIKFALPYKSNWRKEMESLEHELSIAKNSEGEPMKLGEFIYNKLMCGEWQKVRKRVILRSRYVSEFDAIWKEQCKYHELLDKIPKEKLETIAYYLFPGKKESQEKYRKEAVEGGLFHIIRNQIIYYQRPLKSQEELVGKCRYEPDEKVLAKSHPLFQQFIIWQKINDLSINSITEISGKKQYAQRLLNPKERADLFQDLQIQKEISFSSLFKRLNLKANTDFLNGIVFKKGKLQGNETLIIFRKILSDDLFSRIKLNEFVNLVSLWEILYKKQGNEYDLKSERNQAIIEYLGKVGVTLDEKDIVKISKIRFKRDYGSISAKAISKLMVLMQTFEGYDLSVLDDAIVKSKIEHIETGEEDERIEKSLREYYLTFPEVFRSGGMQYAFAAMLLYGVHTAKCVEVENAKKDYHEIKLLEHGSLRNPIVEQIVNETLQQIKWIWKEFGFKPDEIRVELARDLKNNAEQRKKMSDANEKAAKVNGAIITELLRMELPVTSTNILKFKLWEQQKKCCPYSGQPIPLNNSNGLFSGHYDIDHILPLSRYFDDSITNKVLTRREINIDKGNRTAWEYITSSSIISEKLSEEAYIQNITNNFFGRKRTNLLLKKIPEDFIERQKKDTQYISIKVKELLAEIVGTNNVFTSTGIVTDYLRQHWGLTEMFKEITKDRFAFLGSTLGENWVERKFDEERNKHILKIKNWSKRYDHRHHALDALVVACTTPTHIHNLNNLNKKLQTWLQEARHEVFKNVNLSSDEILFAYFNLPAEKREKIQEQIEGFRKFDSPWDGFQEQTKNELLSTVASIKRKPKLLIQKNQKTGQEFLKIRGALHKETIYGTSANKYTFKVPISKISSMAKALDNIVDKELQGDLMNHIRNYESKKEAFSPDGIKEFNRNRKIKVNSVKIRFSKDAQKDDEGLLQRIERKNAHNKSLYVSTRDNFCFAVLIKDESRMYDILSFYDTVNIVNTDLMNGQKNIDQSVRRYFLEIHKEAQLLFTLSHNEVVYLPQTEELPIPLHQTDSCYDEFWNNRAERNKRLFIVVKFSGKLCYFVPVNMAKEISFTPLENKFSENVQLLEKGKTQKIFEFGSYKDSTPFYTEYTNGIRKQIKIQEHCIKVRIDRLGKIIPVL